MSLSAAQKKEASEAFALFDAKKKGKIRTKWLGPLLRSLGKVPSEQFLASFIPSTEKYFTLPQLEEALSKPNSVDERDIENAFTVFADGAGNVSVPEFRHVMTNLGEQLTEEQFEEFLQTAGDVDPDGTMGRQQFFKLLLPAR